MRQLTTIDQFSEVLALARAVRQAREAVDDFERERVAAHPALIRDWEGGARNEFDNHWNTTVNARAVAVEVQMPAWEDDLTQLWVNGAEQHNQASYQLALREAQGALATEEDLYRRSAAFSPGIDTEAIAEFNESPSDRVRQFYMTVTRPTEANSYLPTDSFLHYIRHAGNQWEPYTATYPDVNVLAVM